jgi:hypothetical protein
MKIRQLKIRHLKIRQKLTSIWSLARRSEVTVRIHYRVRGPRAYPGRAQTVRSKSPTGHKGCQIYELRLVEEIGL